ncbi:hypothetical protein [Nocardioides pyridinolyticus]
MTQHNAGRKTAGIDGEVALTSPDRAALAVDLHRNTTPWQARPVKRVYIPKADGKQRPLGIRCCGTGCNRPGSPMRWSRSGRRGSSRALTDSGPGGAVTTRSKRSTGP